MLEEAHVAVVQLVPARDTIVYRNKQKQVLILNTAVRTRAHKLNARTRMRTRNLSCGFTVNDYNRFSRVSIVI